MKNAAIIFMIILIMAGALYVINSRSVDDFVSVKKLNEVTLIEDTHLPSLTKISNSEANSTKKKNIPTGLFNSNAEQAVPECYELSEREISEKYEQITDYRNQHVLMPDSVEDHLTFLNEDELKAEYKAGNIAAAYVLGMNYFHLSHNTSFFNPFLRLSPKIENDKFTGKLNREILEQAREWLWKAALDGISRSLLELSLTYTYEIFYLKQEFENNQTDLSNEDFEVLTQSLKAKELSYMLLEENIFSSGIDILNGPPFLDYRQKFIDLEYEKKEEVLDEILTRWKDERFELGLAQNIEIVVPENIKEIVSQLVNLCEN